MIHLPRQILIDALQDLERVDRKEYANLVGNAMKGHGQFALKKLMKEEKIILNEDQIFEELWEMLKEEKIDEVQHDQFIRDLRHNSKAKSMIGRFLRKARRIRITN